MEAQKKDMEVSMIKCWICGNKATSTRVLDGYAYEEGHTYRYKSVSPWYRCYCDICRDKIDEQEAEERKLYIKLKKKEMFKKACDILENQDTKMYEYKDSIEVVRDFLTNNPDKFDSSYEVLAAIVLVQNHIHSKMQYRIGNYQVDFLLDELGIVLEIDGDRHKYNKKYDSKRDEFIKKELGYGWDIIRIKTDYLD